MFLFIFGASKLTTKEKVLAFGPMMTDHLTKSNFLLGYLSKLKQ